MDERALILFYLFAAANSHVYFDNRHPGHGFPNIPHLINDMINAHRNMMLGNSYNQQQGMSGSNPTVNGMNSGYQQNNIGYQRPSQSSGLDNLNNRPLQDNLSDSSDSSEGPSTGKPSYIDKEVTTTPLPNTSETPKTLRLSTDNPHYLSNSSKLPIDSDTDTAQSLNAKRSTHSLTNNNIKPEVNKNEAISNKKPDMEQNELNKEKDTDKEPLLNKNMELEKETLKVNKPRDPNAIVFPDNKDEIKREAHQIHKGNASELPTKFNDTPQILYAVNIAPSGSNQWSSGLNASPLTNAITSQQLLNAQTPPLTNSQSYAQNNQYLNQPTYATLQSPNQAPLTNKMADTSPFGNSIVLPNPNGGSTLYTIVNLPNTIANANVPSQLYQTSNVISNPSNYQQETSVPTANSGIINGIPTYYVVSLPNKQTPQQNIQVNLPYTNAPVKYTVGYVSSNGQTVLVPSTPVVYQLIAQNLVPVSNNQGNVPQNSYVPVSNVQTSVVAQPVSNSQGNVVSPQTSYVLVSNDQANAGNTQINYVPVLNGQGNSGNTQISYVPVSNGQGNNGNTQISYVPVSNGQENTGNTQISYVPVSNGQENTGNTLIHYVPVSNGQESTDNPQTNYVSVSNGQEDTGNPQNYVQLNSDQGNVVTLTSSPSETVVLPPNTETVTLLSFKDKTEEKTKKKKKKL